MITEVLKNSPVCAKAPSAERKQIIGDYFGACDLMSNPANSARSPLLGSVMVCLFLAGVSKAVEHINKTIAPALVSQVGIFIL